MFKIFETEEFISSLKDRKQFSSKLQTYVYPQLKKQPYFGKNIKKLKDYNPEIWRYRIGDFRFFYSIDEREKVVFMLSISHRKESYR